MAMLKIAQEPAQLSALYKLHDQNSVLVNKDRPPKPAGHLLGVSAQATVKEVRRSRPSLEFPCGVGSPLMWVSHDTPLRWV